MPVCGDRQEQCLTWVEIPLEEHWQGTAGAGKLFYLKLLTLGVPPDSVPSERESCWAWAAGGCGSVDFGPGIASGKGMAGPPSFHSSPSCSSSSRVRRAWLGVIQAELPRRGHLGPQSR